MNLNQRSIDKMQGIKLDLIRVIEKASDKTSFIVTEGLRSVERQKMLVQAGKSKTMNSYHITGDAVDLAVMVDGKISWDFKEYKKLADVIKEVAKDEGVEIEWGGDWKSFKDGPHFQLKRKG